MDNTDNKEDTHESSALLTIANSLQVTCFSWSNNERFLTLGTLAGYTIVQVCPGILFSELDEKSSPPPSTLNTNNDTERALPLICSRWISGGVEQVSTTDTASRVLVVPKIKPNAIVVTDVYDTDSQIDQMDEVPQTTQTEAGKIVREGPASLLATKEFGGSILFISHTPYLLLVAHLMEGAEERNAIKVQYNVFNLSMESLFTLSTTRKMTRGLPFDWMNHVAVGCSLSQTSQWCAVLPDNEKQKICVLQSEQPQSSTTILSSIQCKRHLVHQSGVLVATVDPDSMSYALLQTTGKRIFIYSLIPFQQLKEIDIMLSNEETNARTVSLGIRRREDESLLLTCITPQRVRIFQIRTSMEVVSAECFTQQWPARFNPTLPNLSFLSSRFLTSFKGKEKRGNQSTIYLGVLPVTTAAVVNTVSKVVKLQNFTDATLKVLRFPSMLSEQCMPVCCRSSYLFQVDHVSSLLHFQHHLKPAQ